MQELVEVKRLKRIKCNLFPQRRWAELVHVAISNSVRITNDIALKGFSQVHSTILSPGTDFSCNWVPPSICLTVLAH
eukprot:2768906-Amphidinium_carterae.1